jgi:hypothetical protein
VIVLLSQVKHSEGRNTMFRITGLDELTSQFEAVTEATKQLNGTLCEVRFNPSDPAQVQDAIRKIERAVDERLSEFPNNPLVRQLATGIKQKFKEEILKRASEARQRLASGGIPFDPLSNPVSGNAPPFSSTEGWPRLL